MISYLQNNGNNGLTLIDKWQPKCWVCVTSPSIEERNHILNKLKIPSNFFYDIQDNEERPRVEIEDGWILIIIRIPVRYTSIPFITVPLGIVIKNDIVVSICFHQNDVIQDFILHTQRKSIYIDNNMNFLLRLLLSSSVWYQKYLKQINTNVRTVEKELELSIRNKDLQNLLKIEKSLVYFITSLKGNSILLSKLIKLVNVFGDFDSELLEDAEIELKQAIETTNVHSDILAGTMDAYASIISNNVNHIMKQLTSITVILMIPTLIASLYGMNLFNALENNQYGFLIVLFIAGACTFLGFLFLRKRNLF